jgi:hypothetical protein
MTGQILDFRQAGGTAQNYVRDTFNEVLQMIDLPIEGLVVALSWAGKSMASRLRRPKCGERPLQVIGAMSLVNDHVLRDVGLDRSTIGAISELSAEEIHGCRLEPEAS